MHEVQRIVAARLAWRWGPDRLGPLLGLPPSTVGAVLRRSGLPRLADIDRPTGLPVRRYEVCHPGVRSTEMRRKPDEVKKHGATFVVCELEPGVADLPSRYGLEVEIAGVYPFIEDVIAAFGQRGATSWRRATSRPPGRALRLRPGTIDRPGAFGGQRGERRRPVCAICAWGEHWSGRGHATSVHLKVDEADLFIDPARCPSDDTSATRSLTTARLVSL